MAKFSNKVGGKEIGSAEVYAEPHTMAGKALTQAELDNGYVSRPSRANSMNVSVGNINRFGYDAGAKTDGIEVRGCGAATKGTKARGPMA